MTDKEWQALYPEDWKPACEAENFNPNEYDLFWDAAYENFRPKRLSWKAGNKAYIDYQSMD